MITADTVPFPIQDEIDPDEDGVGFALRMSTANGITFNRLARFLASPGHCYLPAHASGAVAFMFGCDPVRLASGFVNRYFRNEGYGAAFLGHHFLRPYHLRQTRPQICPYCIEQKPQAHAAWSISLVSSCPIHSVRLLDRCRCGRALSWRRPAINLCECGRLLTRANQGIEQADPREVAVSSQVAYLLGPAHFRLTARHGIHHAFDEVAVDTYLRIVWAFGVLADDQSNDYPGCSSRVLRTEEATMIACRAFDRLHTVITRSSGQKQARVCHAALRAIRDDCVSSADFPLIDVLTARVLRSGTRYKARGRSKGHQLSLFGDPDD